VLLLAFIRFLLWHFVVSFECCHLTMDGRLANRLMVIASGALTVADVGGHADWQLFHRA